MPKRITPHCGHVFHFVRCVCHHERMMHYLEKEHCLERGCICLEFRLAAGQSEVEHENLR